MKTRLALVAALVAALLVLVPARGERAEAAEDCRLCIPGQNMVTDSFYTLNVPNGTMAVRVEALIEFDGAKDATAVSLFALPSATNIVFKLKDADTPMKTTVVAGSVGGLVTRSAAVGPGSPDNVIGGGMVCAATNAPFCEHDDKTSSANAGTSIGTDWDTARRFISWNFTPSRLQKDGNSNQTVSACFTPLSSWAVSCGWVTNEGHTSISPMPTPELSNPCLGKTRPAPE